MPIEIKDHAVSLFKAPVYGKVEFWGLSRTRILAQWNGISVANNGFLQIARLQTIEVAYTNIYKQSN